MEKVVFINVKLFPKLSIGLYRQIDNGDMWFKIDNKVKGKLDRSIRFSDVLEIQLDWGRDE